jgi:hypothetical protein
MKSLLQYKFVVWVIGCSILVAAGFVVWNRLRNGEFLHVILLLSVALFFGWQQYRSARAVSRR